MAIGVFGLQVAYKLKRLEVMSTTNTHGWFGGGRNTGPNLSLVDRIDFSNDTGTANIRGPLTLARNYPAATGNSNYGWFGGGGSPLSSTVDRIDFSNDSSTASPRGPLTLARYRFAATGNSNYGWFGGGYTAATPAATAVVDRIDFSNDSSTASPRGLLSLARYWAASTGNSNYGWFGGGFNPAATPSAYVSTVDRIDFSNDFGTASVRGSLSLARSYLAATGNSNYGWFGGGRTPGTVSTIERIDFSNDSSTASVRGSLSLARSYLAATGNSNYGWFGGGYTAGAFVATVDRIDFSNDNATASPRGPLSSARGYLAATSGQAKGPSIKLQKAGNYGWFGGGVTGIPALSTVDRIDFSNDFATALVRSPLNVAREALAATGNSNSGWFGGGFSLISTIERVNFSNDSSSLSIRGPLNVGRAGLIATGNSNYGWFGGGSTAPASIRTTQTIVDRIDFSNDSATASVRGPLSLARQNLAATGNSNYGWFGGGFNVPVSPAFYSRIDRVDFSNDSATASPRGPLSSARGYLAATGNSNYGWFGGGYPGSGTVDRIDFSNDSISASPRGSLSLARSYLAATGNSNYGWFGGGLIPGPATVSTVDRIDFSNDSSTASPRGPLSLTRGSLAATSNRTR